MGSSSGTGPTCGDGTVNATGEQCDDGNNSPNDGCEPDCTLICGYVPGAVRATLDASNNHCYVGFSQPLEWMTAEVECEGHQGTLAVITSSAENTLARAATLLTDTVWIGGEDLFAEGTFMWVNGEPFSFSQFEPGQPDNDASTGNDGDCLHFLNAVSSPSSSTSNWNDTHCGLPAVVTGYVCEIPPPAGRLIINEVDYDQAGLEQGTNAASFIELKNVGSGPVTLADFAVALVNGNTNDVIARFDLAPAGTSLMPGQFLVLGNTNVTAASGAIKYVPTGVANTDFIQNGAPDGVALINITTGTLVDALSYEGSITAATITGVGVVSLVEGSPFAGADTNDNLNALARFPDGTDTDNAATDWALRPPSPGSAN